MAAGGIGTSAAIAAEAATLQEKTASATLATEPKNRVRDFSFQSASRIEAQQSLTPKPHWGHHRTITTNASEFPLAPKGGNTRGNRIPESERARAKEPAWPGGAQQGGHDQW